MKKIKMLNSRNGKELQVSLADTPWLRLRGLLGRAPLQSDQGMLISPCNAVHTMWMGYPLDLVYLDRRHKVVRIVTGLKPWRSSHCRQASSVLELAAGSVAQLQITQGDELIWDPN
ncbi:DUF192 domain-containing protein [Shewanella cyperi]|uniref:DUF192 domain-containing protein n=1 Tax=Shewanella cyperi TaxID=2814292 RepID=UPI001A9529E7|nr:DUF192 domain-containing protein [Shewanella cyperi]QSX40158.1 DUF192 domain-containing protein [Shewanella cyperi]